MVQHTEWDEPGALSIVVQGGLFQGNLVEAAIHCRHWRDLFPQAEIIFSISVTDVINGRRDNGLLTEPRLIPKHHDDGHLQNALQIMVESCDKIGLCPAALPLPPIKNDSPKLNNMNLQLAAAQNGLALASGTHVLRIRSDMIFTDREFLNQYESVRNLPRGDASVFDQRVMISWLYTLNPYTVERMPLHFSDWFHLGLAQDVRRIWSVPPVTLGDSLYYRTHKHPPGSNRRERQFNTRIAVEQHVIYQCFKPVLPELTLAHHNDDTSVGLAMDILADNFVVCDLATANCVFDKYASEFSDPTKLYHCLTREDWLAMVAARHVDYRQTLADKIAAASAEALPEEDEDFPRTYTASHLRTTRNGELTQGEIVSKASRGLLFFGPYISLKQGRYMASVNLSHLDGTGAIDLRVTSQSGDRVAGSRKLAITRGARPKVSVPFEIRDVEEPEIEILCTLKGKLALRVSSITITRRPEDDDGSSSVWSLLRKRLRP